MVEELPIKSEGRLSGLEPHVGVMKTAGPLKKLIERVDERSRCAVRAREGVTQVSRIAGREVGGEIGSTKTVDRLLGIPHENQAPGMILVIEDSLKNRELTGIGILGLVDQRDLVTGRQVSC